MLINLGGIYPKLNGYQFDWDDAVELTKEQIIDAIPKMSSSYILDTDYITEKTGIPILGTIQAAPSSEEDEKKKLK